MKNGFSIFINRIKHSPLSLAMSLAANLALSLALVLGANQNAKASNPGDLNIGISAEFETLNPLIASQAATTYMLYLAYRPLIILTPDLKWEPLLIKKIPTLENKLAKKVGTTLETQIELIDSAKWGDNTPITCKDIEFTWRVAKSNNVSVQNREPYEQISSITWDEAKPKKCKVVFAKIKYSYFMEFPDPLPAHLEGPIFEKYKNEPEGYDKNTLYTKDPSNPGLYSGPFRISEVKLGSHVIFTENQNFYGKKPFYKKVIFKLIPNNNVLVTNLKSGNIDMIAPPGGLGIDQAIAFEKEVRENKLPFNVVFEPGVIYSHIDLNLDNPILADIKVRQALSHGFNKNELIHSLLEGRAKPAMHFVTDRDPWYTEKVPQYEYDKKKAAALLESAGWKMGPRGYRVKDGKTLSLKLQAASGAKINELIETYLLDQYKSIGIEISIKNEPARVFFGQTTKHRNYDMALYAWVSVPEQSPRSTMHSAQIPTEKNSWSGQNSCGYNNPEADKLIDDLELELNAKKRAELGKKVLALYARDIPVIPVYYRQNNAVVPKAMKDYRLSGHNFYDTLFIENWRQ